MRGAEFTRGRGKTPQAIVIRRDGEASHGRISSDKDRKLKRIPSPTLHMLQCLQGGIFMLFVLHLAARGSQRRSL